MENIYQFSVKNIKHEEISLKQYEGKVILIVNTASKCGLTPQYEGLEKLYKEYKDKDFVVLGFPCNQFMDQEPGSEDEISSFCSANYGVSFPLMEKIDVNGDNAHPLYKFLKSQKGHKDEVCSNKINPLYAMLTVKGFDFKSDDIKWNFGKFLINKNGEVVKRYSPVETPESLKSDIEDILK